jgi:hypothetical protein
MVRTRPVSALIEAIRPIAVLCTRAAWYVVIRRLSWRVGNLPCLVAVMVKRLHFALVGLCVVERR